MPIVNAWNHIAVVRSSGTVSIYLGGISGGSGAMGYDIDTSNSIYVANNYIAGRKFIGYIDEFRLSKGIARWTANFTPPSTAYTTSIQDGCYKDGGGIERRIAWKTSNLDVCFDDGRVGIGTKNPTAPLHVVGLSEYADNATAMAAGLTVGAFYRTGDLLKVVHS